MKPYIHVKFNDGSIFEVPTSIIVQDRAAYYHERDKDEFPTLDDAIKETTDLFSDDSFEIEDWAKNNMNWDEILPHARLIDFEASERDWSASDLSYHDERTTIAPPENVNDMGRIPLDLAIMQMGHQGNCCSFLPIAADAKGMPGGALVLVQGGSQIVQFYLNGLTELTQVLKKLTTAGAPANPTLN